MKEVITPRIRLGRSVSDKLISSLDMSMIGALCGSVNIPVYDSVWRLVRSSVDNSVRSSIKNRI
jgi:hypothetical protein